MLMTRKKWAGERWTESEDMWANVLPDHSGQVHRTSCTTREWEEEIGDVRAGMREHGQECGCVIKIGSERIELMRQEARGRRVRESIDGSIMHTYANESKCEKKCVCFCPLRRT